MTKFVVYDKINTVIKGEIMKKKKTIEPAFGLDVGLLCGVVDRGDSKDWAGRYTFKSRRYEDRGMTVEVEAGEEIMGMIT